MKMPGPSTVEGNRTMAKAIDTDACLIERFARGDTAAFDRLFLKYQDYVYNIVYGIIGKAEEARDVTQEVFVQVFRSLPSFRRGSRFATWLYRIAVNRAVDAARSARNPTRCCSQDRSAWTRRTTSGWSIR